MTDNIRSRGSMAKKIVWAVVIAMAVVTVVNFVVYLMGGSDKGVEQAAVPVLTAPVRESEVEVTLVQSADLRPWREVLVVPKVKGQIMREILVDRGDRVHKGQLMVRLDQQTVLAKRDEVRAGLGESQAAKAAAEAKLHALDKDHSRLTRLTKSGAVAQQELDHIMAEHKVAQAQARLADAQIARAQAMLSQLNLVLDDHNIVASIDGLISGRYQDVGALSDDKTPVLRISDESKIKVLSTVGERDYPLVKAGQKAQIKVDAYPDRTFEATVSLVNPNLNPTTRSAELELVAANDDLALRSGMYAEIRLALGRRKAILAPLSAVLRQAGTGVNYVFVVEGGKVRQVNVKIGAVFGDMREVRSGLGAGQIVVTRGGSRLVDGQVIDATNQAE